MAIDNVTAQQTPKRQDVGKDFRPNHANRDLLIGLFEAATRPVRTSSYDDKVALDPQKLAEVKQHAGNSLESLAGGMRELNRVLAIALDTGEISSDQMQMIAWFQADLLDLITGLDFVRGEAEFHLAEQAMVTH